MMTLEPPRKMGTDWRELGLSRAGLTRFVGVAQRAVGLRGEVEVLLTDDRMLRRLNREWRGKDKSTDVLSFPASVELEGIAAGDLAVSLETAAKQAAEHGHSLRDEVRVLLLHGMLHLAGMDHEVDGGEMAAREAVLRRELRLKSGLIARSTGSREQGLGVRKSKSENAKGAEEERKVRRGGGVSAKAVASVAGVGTQIPFGNDKQKGKRVASGNDKPKSKRIPFGNDKPKSKPIPSGNDKPKGKRRFPLGMTKGNGRGNGEGRVRVVVA